ncbi:hypothetical protein MY9_2571 [Bacillus sp. JS]|nr:hypothetical protein MY9_2571 [Bacillus sp. JS]
MNYDFSIPFIPGKKKSQSQEMPDFDFLIIESDYEMCSFLSAPEAGLT